MRCKCIDRDCEDLQEAVEIVELYEALIEDHKERKKLSVRVVSDTREQPKEVKGMEDVMKRITNFMDKWENSPNNSQQETHSRGPPRRGSQPRLCYECGQPGHLARFCQAPIEERLGVGQQPRGYPPRNAQNPASGNGNPSA